MNISHVLKWLFLKLLQKELHFILKIFIHDDEENMMSDKAILYEIHDSDLTFYDTWYLLRPKDVKNENIKFTKHLKVFPLEKVLYYFTCHESVLLTLFKTREFIYWLRKLEKWHLHSTAINDFVLKMASRITCKFLFFVKHFYAYF